MNNYNYDTILDLGDPPVLRFYRPEGRKLPALFVIASNGESIQVGTFSNDQKADLFIDTMIANFAQKIEKVIE